MPQPPSRRSAGESAEVGRTRARPGVRERHEASASMSRSGTGRAPYRPRIQVLCSKSDQELEQEIVGLARTFLGDPVSAAVQDDRGTQVGYKAVTQRVHLYSRSGPVENRVAVTTHEQCWH